MDSLGRLVAYDALWDNTTHNYTGTAKAERYNPATNSWTLSANAPAPVQIPAFAIDSSDRFYVAAGQDISAHPNTTPAWWLDPSTLTWTNFAALPLYLIEMYSWMDSSGVLWLVMGRTNFTGIQNPDGNGNMANGRRYSGGPSGTWTTLATTPYISGYSGFLPNEFGVVDSLGRAYVTPAAGIGGPYFERYDPSTDTWALLATFPAGLSANNIAITPTDKIYSVGSGLKRYDIATDTWSAALASPPSPWVTSTAYLGYHATTNALYLIGGGSGSPDYFKTIFKYDIATDTWSDTGDLLSVGRFMGINRNVVQDGVGFYIIGGTDKNGDGTTVVEYFVPPGGATHPGGWAAVIG